MHVLAKVQRGRTIWVYDGTKTLESGQMTMLEGSELPSQIIRRPQSHGMKKPATPPQTYLTPTLRLPEVYDTGSRVM